MGRHASREQFDRASMVVVPRPVLDPSSRFYQDPAIDHGPMRVRRGVHRAAHGRARPAHAKAAS